MPFPFLILGAAAAAGIYLNKMIQAGLETARAHAKSQPEYVLLKGKLTKDWVGLYKAHKLGLAVSPRGAWSEPSPVEGLLPFMDAADADVLLLVWRQQAGNAGLTRDFERDVEILQKFLASYSGSKAAPNGKLGIQQYAHGGMLYSDESEAVWRVIGRLAIALNVKQLALPVGGWENMWSSLAYGISGFPATAARALELMSQATGALAATLAKTAATIIAAALGGFWAGVKSDALTLALLGGAGYFGYKHFVKPKTRVLSALPAPRRHRR